jgi:hypothetical protein
MLNGNRLQHLIEIHFCATILKNKFMKLLLFSLILCFGSAAAIAQTTDSIKRCTSKTGKEPKLIRKSICKACQRSNTIIGHTIV